MEIKFHNTLSGQKEVFKPIRPGQTGMYNCGPTVYDYVHIGNLRAYVFADLLRRTLQYNGFEVKQIINITDVGHLRSDADEGEDKMTTALKRQGKPLTLEALKEVADFYTEAFLKNLDELNIERPAALPRASQNIEEDIQLIKLLEAKGFVYKTPDGVYFDTSKDKNYGRLGGLQKIAEAASRVTENPEKRNPRDFALWKFNNELGWPSPWGAGFPGWHIECSAMSMKYLGETFDIHTGGMDHIPIHHNNEIAQSESATGKALANFWLHNAFVVVNDEKMAKSAGNFWTLEKLKENGIYPIAYRYWLLTSHYRSPVNFSVEAVRGSQAALNRLASHLSGTGRFAAGAINPKYRDQFLTFINDDLDTPQALALIWDLLKDSNVSEADKRATILDFDRVLGLNLTKLSEPAYFRIPEEVTKLAETRKKARKSKDWAKADELRKEILALDYEINDTDEGYKILPKS